jgi:hypothetical protein
MAFAEPGILSMVPVTTSGLVKFHDEILKASFEQRDQAIQSWVHGFTRPMLTELMRGLSWIGSPFVLDLTP